MLDAWIWGRQEEATVTSFESKSWHFSTTVTSDDLSYADRVWSAENPCYCAQGVNRSKLKVHLLKVQRTMKFLTRPFISFNPHNMFSCYSMEKTLLKILWKLLIAQLFQQHWHWKCIYSSPNWACGDRSRARGKICDKSGQAFVTIFEKPVAFLKKLYSFVIFEQAFER